MKDSLIMNYSNNNIFFICFFLISPKYFVEDSNNHATCKN